MRALAVVRKVIEEVNTTILLHPMCALTEADIKARLYAELLPYFGGLQRVRNTADWGTHRRRIN